MSIRDELKTIADTVETNGGWHIASLKIRQAIERIDELEEQLAKESKWRQLTQAGVPFRELKIQGKRIAELESSLAQAREEAGRYKAALDDLPSILRPQAE